MNRSDFIKLAATGVFIPPTFFIGCSKTKKKRSTKPKPKEVTDPKVEQFQKKSSSAKRTFNSIAKLKNEYHNLAKKDSGEYNRVQLLGYYKPDDGGSGVFYWDADATEADNGGTIIKPEADKFTHSGRWKRVLKNDEVNVKAFGAKGDGSGVDDQPSIQKAINYASGNNIAKVVIPKGDYTVGLNISEIRPTALSLKNNTHLVMDIHATLRLGEDEYATSYSMLSIVNRKNVAIEGGSIIGNKLTSTANRSEYGFGISLITSENVTISNMNLKEQWGDGIYIGRYGGKGSKCKNITITDTICDNNRRQGMSVISVDGLHVEKCKFNNTGGTAPQAGIDFEPNASDEVLQNIVMKNIECNDNNGSGILFVLVHLRTPDNPEITINIGDVYIENPQSSGINISKNFSVPGVGHLTFKNITVKNNYSGAAYMVENWHKDAPTITFKNITAINPNTSGKGGKRQGSAFVIYDSKLSYEQGNVHIDGFRVKSDGSATGKAPKDIYADKNLWNCSFKNIKSNVNALYGIQYLDVKKNNVIDPNLIKKFKE